MRRRWRLELGEGHLDRVEVGRVGRQEQEPGALLRAGWPSALGLLWTARLSRMTTSPFLQVRGELGLDPGVEGGAVDRPLEDPRRDQAVVSQTGDEGLGALRAAKRRMVAHPLAAPRRGRAPGSCWSWCRIRRRRPADAAPRASAAGAALSSPRAPRARPPARAPKHAATFFVRQPVPGQHPRDRRHGCAFTPCSSLERPRESHGVGCRAPPSNDRRRESRPWGASSPAPADAPAYAASSAVRRSPGSPRSSNPPSYALYHHSCAPLPAATRPAATSPHTRSLIEVILICPAPPPSNT